MHGDLVAARWVGVLAGDHRLLEQIAGLVVAMLAGDRSGEHGDVSSDVYLARLRRLPAQRHRAPGMGLRLRIPLPGVCEAGEVVVQARGVARCRTGLVEDAPNL